ncbi:MAG: hypothetical protein O2967_01550 [Proteobacteria bacterium]|nr:hypothetical protein [Pseudomonadota bacterium]
MQSQKLALGLIEGGLTLSGVTAAVTPLALWVAWSEMVFYLVLSVGCGAFLIFIGLARLRGLLAPDHAPGAKVIDFESLRRRRVDWEQLQDEDRGVRRRQRSIKGDAQREFGYMVRITTSLILIAVLLFLAVWAMMEIRYG